VQCRPFMDRIAQRDHVAIRISPAPKKKPG
jgi:hypothetical protein